jgi:hypothetical protein
MKPGAPLDMATPQARTRRATKCTQRNNKHTQAHTARHKGQSSLARRQEGMHSKAGPANKTVLKCCSRSWPPAAGLALTVLLLHHLPLHLSSACAPACRQLHVAACQPVHRPSYSTCYVLVATYWSLGSHPRNSG